MKMKHLYILLFALAFVCRSEETARKFSLQECIDYAMKHSPTLAKQEISVKNQKLQTVIEEAQFAFTLSANDSHHVHAGEDSGTVTLSKEFKSGFEVRTWVNAARRNGEGVTSNYVALQVSKTLIGGGSKLETTYGLEASLIDELEALNTMNRAKRKLAQDVKLAYYNVIQAQQSLLVKERALENSKHTLALTREREKPLDILTAEIRIPENEISVNSAKRTISNGLDSLKQLMGMEIGEQFDITGEFDFEIRSFDLAKDIEFGRENLETFVNNRLERKKLEMQCKINDGKTWPTVSVNATHYKYGDNENFNFHGREEQVVSLNLTYDIGRRADTARLGKAVNNLENNNHDYFVLDQALAVDLNGYHRRLIESEAAVKLQENLCDFYRKKEELYKDKWENGEIDILELVRTQTDLENAYVELINRKINYMELVANYEYAVGR